MTTSLTCFLGELLKVRNANGDSSFAEVLIVDDNAQLTPENRIKNTISFATNASGASSHLNSRWSSQPSLVTSCMNQSSHLGSSRWNRYTGTCNTDTATSQKNASWNVLLPNEVFVVVDDDDHAETSHKLKNSAIMEPDDIPLSNPLILIDCEKRRLSPKSVHAPQLPQRSSSRPGVLKARMVEKTKRSDRHARNSLRAALGVMAPESSLVERKMV